VSNYEEMTKEELLEEAKARGISPANANMLKAELVEALEANDAGEEPAQQEAGESPELLVTTTMTKDYLGAALVNPTPGTSQATDRLGRSVVAANKDYMGRSLVP
jgi:hypothetical protein